MTRSLIVDDKPENLYLLRTVLEAYGCVVDEARHGAEALVKARLHPPDLIVSDLLMPVMDGYTLLRHWKSDERLKTIPFVVYTATYTEAKDERLALDLGADAFILKPVEPEPLMQFLEAVIAKAKRYEFQPIRLPKGDHDALLKDYGDVLIRKLEEKALQLNEANRALKESEERFRIAANSVSDLVWDWDIAADRLQWFGHAEAMLGYGPEEFPRSFAALEGMIHADDRARVRAALERHLARREPYREEYRVRRKDGAWACWNDTGTALRDKQGVALRMIGASRDVTEQKQLEAQFLRAQRLESVGQMAGGVAHDLNNVLAPILMVASVLREEISSPSGQGLLDTLEASAQRGAGIVKQLLLFARGQAGEKTSLQPRHLVQEVAAMIRETFPRLIVLQTRVAQDLWTVTGDVTQLHQVLLNLAVNARDAMPQGGTLTLAAENVTLDESDAARMPPLKPGRHVLLSVADTGVGIAPEIAEKIFDPFFSTKAPGQGTGLGLPTVLAICRGHGGCLKFDSALGQGTSFKVYLPACLQDVAGAGIRTPVDAPSGQGEWVLVVDDERSIRNVCQLVLESHGYRTLLARDGREGLALYIANQTKIALVLTDLNMPTQDGAALITALRKLSPRLRIVVATGVAFPPEASVVEKLGVPVSLLKPFGPAALLQTVHEALHGPPGTGAVVCDAAGPPGAPSS